MDATEPAAQEPPPRRRFSATLTPHRSLAPRGFLILMTGLGVVSFITGVAFASVGAWPVFGFFGLDVLIVYIAFRLNYRSGRLFERIEIADGELALTRVHPSGRQERYTFQSYWARILLAVEQDGRSRLSIASHGREVAFASFLSNDERESLAAALRQALHAARQTP